MMASILALALVAQFADGADDAPAKPARAYGTPDARDDLLFMRAVEEFAGATPPEPYRAMILALGVSEWKKRESASMALDLRLRAHPEAARWLFWGRRHADPEICLRCNGILRRLNPCSTCRGVGKSTNWELWPCWDCQGAATAWPWSMWD